MRELLRLVLRGSPDLEVVAEAADGFAALAAFEELDAPPIPHVVVLDNQMPGLSGLEVARQLRERVPDQRIVIFSAFVDAAMRVEAQAIGVADVVSKLDWATLPDVLRRT